MKEYICRHCGSAAYDEPGLCCGAEREVSCPHGLAKSQCEICSGGNAQSDRDSEDISF